MEPISTIFGALVGDLFKDGVKAVTSDKIKQWRTRFAQLKPADAQVVQRAVLTAYWQAVLHVFAAHARELNLDIEAMLKREGFKEVVAELCQLGQYVVDASLPSLIPSRTSWQRFFNVAAASSQLSLPPAPDEREWLPRAILKVWSHLATIRTTETALPALPADEELERWLARPFTHDDARELELRGALLNRVITDVEKLCGNLPGEALIAALQKDWHKCFRAALHATLAPGQTATTTHQNQQLAEILCRLQDNPAVTPDGLRAALALNNTALIQRLDDITEQLQQRAFGDEAQIWLAPLFATAQNLEQAFAALPEVVRQDGAQTRGEMHERFNMLEGIVSGTPSVPRELELRYLNWLKNEKLKAERKYIKLKGSKRAKPRAEMNPMCERRKLGKQPSQPDEIETFPDALPELSGARQPLVLLGEPGGGKTTTLQKLVAHLSAEALAEADKPLPLFVPLKFWVTDVPLKTFIQQTFCHKDYGDLGNHLDALLEQKRVTVLLDGLNELPVNQRDTKYKQVWEWLAQDRQTLCVVSCRLRDYPEEERKLRRFDTITITELDALGIRDFAHRDQGDVQLGEILFWQLAGETTQEYHADFIARVGAEHEAAFWCAAALPDGLRWNRYEWDDDGKHGSAWTDWHKHRERPESLLVLARNPYMLSMFASVFSDNETHTLPTNRGALFQLFVETLIDRERRDDQPISESEEKELIAALARLAYAMQTKGAALLAQNDDSDDDNEAKENLASTTLPLTEAQALISDHLLGLARSASLLAYGEPVSFFHQLLQEFFAAKYMDIAALETGELKATDIWRPERWWQPTNWEEATKFWAGFYLNDCTRIIEWLADAQPELAVECIEKSGAALAETTREATLAGLREKWLPRLTDLQTDPNPQARAAIGRALSRLNLDHRKGVALDADGLPDIDWVEIPDEGEFVYGAETQADDQDWFAPAKLQTILALPTFWMSRYPVTNAQFKAFTDHLAEHHDADRWFEGLAADEDERRIDENPSFNFANHPRVDVSWYQAIAFCRWLSWRRNGGYDLKCVDQWAVRLPTEAEWERAARGKDGLVYSYGNEFDAQMGNVRDTGIGQTSAVGIFPQGELQQTDVCDLTGNVWEWCLSQYKKPEVKPNLEARKEKLGTDKARVLRGGAWNGSQSLARAVDRVIDSPGGRYYDLGFRVVLFRPPS